MQKIANGGGLHRWSLENPFVSLLRVALWIHLSQSRRNASCFVGDFFAGWTPKVQLPVVVCGWFKVGTCWNMEIFFLSGGILGEKWKRLWSWFCYPVDIKKNLYTCIRFL